MIGVLGDRRNGKLYSIPGADVIDRPFRVVCSDGQKIACYRFGDGVQRSAR